MEFVARVLGVGLDVIQALPRRGRGSAVVAVTILLIIGWWPELLIEIGRIHAEPIVEAVTQAVQNVGSQARN